ncbi:ROK family protein [Granulicella sp. dw_53]|uniref:ROK family transcriptional regulator n=1 Tax=Granulicella sp. dw_53 TaxID=2719792 RepID=UPI001BD2E5B9|nr:ROK family protein [Granulicella sp. dw_53]
MTKLSRDTHSVGRVHGVRRIDLSSAQLATSESARDINRDIILELIRFRQPVARASLSRLSGLRPSTISAIVEQLIEENWVTEGAVVKASRGRPSTMLSVNPDIVTLALDLRPDRAILAVVDLSGRFLSRETVMTYSNPDRTVAHIVTRIGLLRDQHADKSFEGIGVSVPGRVHPATQRLLLAPNLKWHGFDLKGALEKESKLQVEIDNDANACLLSELWYGRLEGVRNAVLVAIAEGIGTSILADGQLHSGYNGLAGEFGHISMDPSGPLCGCGQRGCWEMSASSRAALHFYRELVPKSSMRNIYQLLSLAEEEDAAAVEAVSRQARALGRGLRLITAALSPELILITGDITASWERFGPIVQKELEDSMLVGPAPRLRISGDAELARLSGSAAMLMQRHASYHRSTHASQKGRGLPASSARLAG